MNVLWLLSLACAVTGAPFPPCPTDCECLTVDMVTTTRCSSLAFIQDAPADQLNKVSHLDVRHANLTKTATVRKLHGLKSLNMAHNDIRHLGDLTSLSKLAMLNLRANKLKTLEEPHLPKNLEHLDVSANHLATFPSFGQLKRLKELNLADNPFMCTCELKTKCEDLQKLVTLVKPVTCRDGSGHVRPVSEVSCAGVRSEDHLGHNDLEKMQNDEELEGSGEEPEEADVDSTDIFAENDQMDPKKLEEIQNEELLPTATTKLPELTEEDYEDNGEDEEEGSGHPGDTLAENEDEGSGSGILLPHATEEPLKACNFNCTPITIDESKTDANRTEPDPNLMDEVSKVIQEIFCEDEEEDKQEASEETLTEAPMVNVEVKKSESGRSGDGTAVVLNEEDKVHAVEDTEASEVKEAGSPLGISNNMIVIIALVVVMLCIMIYTVLVKRRKSRRRRQNDRNGSSTPGQEMKVIKPTKPARQSLPPADKGKVPEKVPLMNGQNDAAKNGNAADAATPLISEPEPEKEEPAVQMRAPRGDHSPLLPEAHRVSVQAKELPRPKTPLLVTRVRSQDGQIVTTPDADQRH